TLRNGEIMQLRYSRPVLVILEVTRRIAEHHPLGRVVDLAEVLRDLHGVVAAKGCDLRDEALREHCRAAGLLRENGLWRYPGRRQDERLPIPPHTGRDRSRDLHERAGVFS